MTRIVSSVAMLVVSALAVCFSEAIAEEAPPAAPPNIKQLDAKQLYAEQLVRQLAARCRPWLNQPGPKLQSLRYTYHLGGDERVVELTPNGPGARRSKWHGTTLSTGLRALAVAPDDFQVTAQRIEDDASYPTPFLRLTVRPKLPDGSFHLEVGNGIEHSWHGYYSHSSAQMQIDLDAETLLPMRELHEFSRYAFRDWQEVQPEAWAPRLVVANFKNDTEYRMHFAWQGDAVWLLTHAETVYDEQVRPVARVSDVQVNDQAITVALSEEHKRLDAARQIVRDMLDRNAAWLAPRPSFESLQYAFHTERQNVTETCVVRRDGFAAFEVTADGQGQMAGQLGDRKIVTTDDRYATAKRDAVRANVRETPTDRDEPNRALQLRRYAQLGCQFDLPLFALRAALDDAMVEIEDGQWNGVPCHVATITPQGGYAYLGCGVMLGFTSWSYVHHHIPAYEVIYIDKQRLAPLHETLVTSRDGRRFEIDFSDYHAIAAEQGGQAPLRIEIAAKDYFTCRYEFQLAGDRHWMLRAVESWFDPAERSRGTVTNVRIDAPSELADAAERQVAAYHDVFESPEDAAVSAVESDAADATPAATRTVDTLPFALGQPVKIGAASVVFTLDRRGNLLLRCTTPQGGAAVGTPVVVLLLDEQNRLIQACSAPFVADAGQLRAKADLGDSFALNSVTRFAIAGLGDISSIAGFEQRQLRVTPVKLGAEPRRTRGIADESMKTQVVHVALQQDVPGMPNVAVHLASHDGPCEFALDAVVAAFDKSGRLVTATAKSGALTVESDLVEETWEVALPVATDLQQIDAVAVGVARGATIRAPIGSLWGSFARGPGPFSLETRLSAADPECWPAALDLLTRDLEDALNDGLFDYAYAWRRQQAEHETPVERLRPHVGRVLEIVDRAEDSATLAAAIRLLGYAGDPRAVDPARRLFASDDATVRDAAAIALGLLNDAGALVQLDEILARPQPTEDDANVREIAQARRDALVALAMIRTDASIALVQKWLDSYIDGSEFVAAQHGPRLQGTAYQAQQLAQLLGRVSDARYLPILIAALGRAEERKLQLVPAQEELLAAIVSYGPAAREFLEPRVRRGDVETLAAISDAHDTSYIDAVADVLETSADLTLWRLAVRYLGNHDSPETLSSLRRAFDRGVPAGGAQEATLLDLAETLARRGDARGLAPAFAVLIELAEPGDLPADDDEKHTWERRLEDRRDDALDVFDDAPTKDVAAFLVERTTNADAATQLALLQIVEQMNAMPAAIRPTIEQWAAESANPDVAQLAQRLLATR